MPANDFDSEALLSFVSELSRRVEDLKKEIVSLGDQSGTGLRKSSEQMEKLGQQVDKTAKPLKAMKDQSSNLVSALRGSVGLGVAFYSASQAMENFVRGELQLRNFAIDVGLTSSEVSRMRTQLSAAGIDAGTANQQLGSLASKLDSIKTYQTASPVYKAVAANDPILAKQLLDAEKIGNRMGSIDAIRQKWNVPGERSKLYLGETLGVTASTMQALNKNQTGLVQPWEYSEKELEKANRDWTNLITTVTNYWGASMMKMVGSTNEFVTNTEKEWGGITTWFQGLKDDFAGKGKAGEQIFGPKGFLPDKKELEDAWEALKKQMSSEAHAAVPTGADTLLEGDPSFSQRFGEWSKDSLDVQKDSGKLLQDIRDALAAPAVSEGELAGMGGSKGFGRRGFGGGRRGGGQADDGDGKPSTETGDAKPDGDGTAKTADTTSGNFPERVQAVGGKNPKAFIVHHTGGRGTIEGVQATLRQRGLGVEYVMDRDGNIKITGGPGAANIKRGWGQYGEGLSNANIVGMEIIAKSDKDVTEKQKAAFAAFIAARYPNTPLFGHGQVNPGHKEADEGMSARAAALELRNRLASRDAVDKGLKADAGNTKNTASVSVEFNGVPKGVKTEAALLDQGVFNTLNIKKSQQATNAQAN